MEETSTIGKLSARRRVTTGKEQAAKLRNQGLIPAVCYGRGTETISLMVDPVALKKALDPGKHQNTLIALTIEDEGQQSQRLSVMLKDYQIDPLKRTVLHADFVRVAEDQIIRAQVPLILEGKPEGVKAGGNLHQVFRHLPVRCPANKIPVSLSADVSALNIADAIRVKDIQGLPAGMQIDLPDNQTVALVMAPRKVQEVTEVAAGAEGAEGAPAEGGEAEAAEEKAEE